MSNRIIKGVVAVVIAAVALFGGGIQAQAATGTSAVVPAAVGQMALDLTRDAGARTPATDVEAMAVWPVVEELVEWNWSRIVAAVTGARPR